jgi:arylsulfatase A-like enzyme
MRVTPTAALAALLVLGPGAAPAAPRQPHTAAPHTAEPHNVVLFVPDGLRALKVTSETAPAMAALRDKGVNFANSHSLFPTFTMPNASGLASGHYLGDTGVFSNVIFAGYPVGPANASVTPFIENDAVLGDIDEHFAGNFIDEDTLLKLARDAGFSTAAVGKLGPTLMFDHTERSGTSTIIIDDQTGSAAGIPLSDEMKAALGAAGLPTATPPRGANGKAGDFQTPGTTAANAVQQAFLADAVTKAILPLFKARAKPFVLVVWSRDPDGSQHNQGDSLNSLTPGINGPTSLAGIRNADDTLAQVLRGLKDLGLEDTTDVVVAADHGFSTISKESHTSPAAGGTYPDVNPGFLPPGFVALDLAKALDLPLFDPDNKKAAVAPGAYPRVGNGLIGKDPDQPGVVVAANGGSDLIYLPGKDRALARRVVDALLAQDYVSGLFVDDALGPIAGTLRLSAINLQGAAITPRPAIVVNFRSTGTGCDRPVLCTAEVADTRLQQGQGMHGNFARSDTQNFMAAAGPDFKAGYVDQLPVSNADVGVTIARLLGLRTRPRGELVGRVVTEAMPNGATPKAFSGSLAATPAANGLRTVLRFQRVGAQRYFDAAGFAGRTVGLEAESVKDR